MPNKLLVIAKAYSSAEEFKAKNLPKYLIARRKGILYKAFPREKSKPKPLKGIYFLYQSGTLKYIGYSMDDAIKDIANHVGGQFTFNRYRLFHKMHSDSDIAVIAIYMANKFKPEFNTNTYKYALTFKIPGISKIMGHPIKGQI